MAQTALFVRPMARKKPVFGKYNPNSFRVISYDAESNEIPSPVHPSLPKSNIIGQSKDSTAVSESEHRYNRPNATSVGFLSQDVCLLNEPICDVRTESTKGEQRDWWPSRISNEPLQVPPHPLDSTVREDFQWRGKGLQPTLRYSSNPNKTPVLGSVPVNFLRDPSGKQRFWKEGISYEHQYNCRLEPQYPIRGKRHGSFVWDRMAEPDAERMVKQYHYNQMPTMKKQADIKEVEMLPDVVVPAPAAEHKPQETLRTSFVASQDTPKMKKPVVPETDVKPSLGSSPEAMLDPMPPVGS